MKAIIMRRQQMQGGLILIPMLLALLLLVSHCGASAPDLEHKCIQDTEEMQTMIHGPVVDVETGLRYGFTLQGMLERTAPQKYPPVPPADAPEEVHRAFRAMAIGKIRFHTSILDLEDEKKYCTRHNIAWNNFSDGSVWCTEADIFTDAKKEILLDKVLPGALGILSSLLMVKRVEGNLIAGGCKKYNVPANHSTSGVPDADYVLYVSAGPTIGGSVATANYCKLDEENRPVTGRLNFGPKYLVWNNVNTNTQRQLVRFVVHEMLHALGFSARFWNENFPAGIPIATETRRGKTVHYFNSKNVVKKARMQFNCESLSGPEMEGQGSSHWDRRNHMDDIMTVSPPGQMYLTPITLAVLEDSGHYTVDWTKAENPKWMYKGGCEMYSAKCNTAAGGMGKYFCFDEKDEVSCTADHRSFGECAIRTYGEPLPEWAQYFPGDTKKGGTWYEMDYCPIVIHMSHRQCDNPSNEEANHTIEAQYYANDGRCFNTKNVIKTGGTPESPSSVKPANCLQTRCVRHAVQFKIPNHAEWIACPSKGDEVTLSQYGYDGAVICPDPNLICDGVEINEPSTTTTTEKTPTGTITTAITTTSPGATITTITEKTPNGTIITTIKETPTGTTTTTSKETPTGITTKTTIQISQPKTKSATAISSTIPAVLISSVVLLYLSHLGY